MVNLPEEGLLLRIFIGESDKYKERPLYEIIVEEARRRGLAGATVIRGIMGFGASSLIHTTKILRLSEDLPMIIEIVDETKKIEAFLPYIDEKIKEGLVTLERVHVVAYRNGRTNA